MPYGEIRVDTITFTNAGVDKSITVSGLFASTSGNLTVTGTVSGTTFTGTTANFTSGNVTTFSGGTCTITSGVFASGTATNPSISFIADSNTGLYSPGADQVAIATSGTGRLQINNDGSIGINTGAKLGFGGFSANPGAHYIKYDSGIDGLELNGYGAIAFQTLGTERMHIDSSGRVGIGTSSPSGTLTVQGAVLGATSYLNEQVSIFNSQTGSTGNQATLGFHLNNANWGPATTYARVSAVLENGTTGATSLAFGTAADGSLSTPNERVRIDSSGRVGIGTSSPISRLHINDGELTISTGGNTSDAGGIINFSIAALPSYSPIATVQGLLVNATGTELQGGLGFFTRPSGAAGQSLHRRMTLSEAGNLGIGVSSPGYRLDITSADTTASVGYAVRLRANATAGAAALQFTDNGATAQYGYIACDSSLNLKFATGTTERVRIDSSGRVGIGTSSPQALLDCSATGSQEIRISSVTSGDVRFGMSAVGATYNWIDTERSSSAMKFGVGNTERLRIDSSGIVTLQTPTNANGLNLGTESKVCTDKIIFTTSAYYVVNGSAVGVILSTGSTAWAANSDERLKTDLEPITDGLEKVGALRAVTGKYISDEEGVRRSFLIAQDVQAVLPEAVSIGEDEDETLSLRYTEVVPLLVAALKEAKKRIETLEAKVAALEAP